MPELSSAPVLEESPSRPKLYLAPSKSARIFSGLSFAVFGLGSASTILIYIESIDRYGSVESSGAIIALAVLAGSLFWGFFLKAMGALAQDLSIVRRIMLLREPETEIAPIPGKSSTPGSGPVKALVAWWICPDCRSKNAAESGKCSWCSTEKPAGAIIYRSQ